MAQRKPDATFLTTLVELRFAIGVIQSVLEQDDALAALARTGFDKSALECASRGFAQPFLVSLLEFLRGNLASSLIDDHKEHSATFSVLIRSTEHDIKNLADESQSGDLRRYAANYNLTRCKELVGMAIRSEIGTVAEKTALEAKHRPANK